jgi:tetratricopeptide (TPR) repeat protein
LFTPQRLFGEVWVPPNTLSYEPFLERARLQRELDRDASARLALGGYVVARLVDKLLTLDTAADAMEAYRWQLQAVRRHVDELPEGAPETAHLSGVVAAVPEHGQPTSSLWMSLTAYAYFLEHEARLEEALEMVMLAARAQGAHASAKDFATYALSAGRLNRVLARWEVAIECYSAAEEAALTANDPLIALRSRLGQGAVHSGKGNFPLARAAAEGVLQDARQQQVVEAEAMAQADLGFVYNQLGLRLESLKALYEAFRLSPDPIQKMRTLGDLGIGLAEIGASDAARVALRIVTASSANVLVRVNALIELMDIESVAGNRVAFERCRGAAEEHRERMSPSMAVDYHYKLGTGLARFGLKARARETLTAALTLAETHRLNAWYFRIEQTLNSLTREQVQASTESAELSQDEVIDAMMVGLQEFAATAAM